MSNVYFVRPVGQAGPVKIGCSESPIDRLSTLMTWSPVLLEVVIAIPGDLKLERRIHGIFAESHSHREWFHASTRLTDFMRSLASGVPIAELIDLSAPILKFRTHNRRKDISDDRRRYLSTSARVRNAFRRLWKLAAAARHAPDDVDAIVARWDGASSSVRPRYARIEARLPTPEELQRIEDVLRDPAAHAMSSEQKWPKAKAA